MVAAENLYESARAAKIERCANLAYAMSRQDPWSFEGPGALLERLMGPACVELVDHGVQPGRALLEFAPLRPMSADPMRPVCVRMDRHQRPEQAVLASAVAVAQYVAWARCERWDEAMVEAVSLAVACPQEPFHEALRDEGVRVA